MHGYLKRQLCFLLLLAASPVLAVDIEGAQSAALDQPRIYLSLRRSAAGEPLTAKARESDLGKLLGLDPAGAGATIAVAAFLDTGASGVVLSTASASAMGVQRQQKPAAAGPVVFHDVGVAGGDQFHVSEPLFLALAPYHPQTSTEQPDAYRATTVAMRLQVGPLNSHGLTAMLLGSLDVVGMPLLQGQVMVVDARPVNTLSDTLRTYVYPAGTPYNASRQAQDPGIPPVDRHVALSYADFGPFTRIEPEGAARPNTSANPFIGPNPLQRQKSGVPAVQASYRGRSASGSWLLDTGAAASIISRQQAAALGVTYRAGTEGTLSPALDGVPPEKQFALTVGGIGGSKKAAGFVLDELRLATREGDPLVYKGAPVLVADITVEHPQTHEKITLDGVFGMNFLVASAQVSETGLLPDIGKMSEGAFDWIIFDQPRGELGLKLRK